MTFTTSVPSSRTPRHTGIGVAQYLSRERFQSGADSIIFLNRPSFKWDGVQLTFEFWSNISDF